MPTPLTSRLRLAAFAALLAPLAGCPAPAPVVEPPPAEPPNEGGATPAVRSGDLDEAMARWEAADLGAYRLTLQRSCFCPSPDYTGPFDVTVRDGVIEAVRLSGERVDAERGMTVRALFDLIEEAYDRGAEVVRVTFDPEVGVPTEVYIDYSSQMADEEISYTVTGFEALGG